MTAARTETAPPYSVAPWSPSADDEATIAAALRILENRVIGQSLTSPADARNFLRLKLALLDHEVFCALFLDAQHRVIHFAELFHGTLTQVSVYPREVVRAALALNAGAVILCHNHPSGSPEPSRADEHITQTLKAALALVDVRVIDHVVVASTGAVSLAERGLM
jgi:DNA repair protein RadC